MINYFKIIFKTIRFQKFVSFRLQIGW